MFPEMRFKKCQVSEEKAKEFLRKGNYGFLSTISEIGYPYSVPINYIYYKDAIYVHCSKKGHKIDNIKNSNKVSFSVVTYEAIDEEGVSTDYESVIVFGKAIIVPKEDSTEIYNVIMERLTPSYSEKASYIAKHAPAAEVIKIEIEYISGKARYDKKLRG